MSRMVKAVSDMDFDEVSLVDLPANQYARVALAKRAEQEDAVADYFDEDGAPVEPGQFQEGEAVFDSAGNLLGEWTYADDAAVAEELAPVSKRDPGAVFGTAPAELSKSASDQIRELLSKAVTESDRDDVIAKVADQISKADARANAAEAIAKSEQTLRLTREYISKAAEYNVPIAADELGPVLLGMANAEFAGELPDGSCAVIHKALSAAGAMLFTEAGFDGSADNVDAFSEIDAIIAGEVSKSGAESISKEHAVATYFETNPRAYDDYVAGLGR